MAGNLIIEPAGNEDYAEEEVYGNQTMSGDTTEEQGPYISLLEPLNNLTKKSGQSVKLKCQVEGTLPIDFKWFKNDAPLIKEKGKVNVNDRENWSRLRINNLNTLDTGYYKCQASNKGGKIETTSVLKVSAVMNKPRSNNGMFDHDSNILQENSNLDFNKHATADRKICRKYEGQACARYLAGKNVLVSEDHNEMTTAERIVLDASQVIKNLSQVSEPCKRYAEKAACFHSYQICDPQPSSYSSSFGSNQMTVLQICKRDCLVIEKDLCPDEYTTARSEGMVGKLHLLPDCSELSDEAESCSKLLGDFNELPQSDQNCYHGNGANYRGTASTTESGKLCQKWLDVRRKFPLYKSSRFLELTDNNHCRNPGGEKPRLWCFNSAGNQEYCKVHVCSSESDGSATNTAKGAASAPSVFGGFGAVTAFLGIPPQYSHYALMLTGVLSVLLVVLFLALIYKLCKSRARVNKKRPKKQNGPGSHQGVNGFLTNGGGPKPGQPYTDQQQLEMMHLMASSQGQAPQRHATTRCPQNLLAASQAHLADDSSCFVHQIHAGNLRFIEKIGEAPQWCRLSSVSCKALAAGQYGKLWSGTLTPFSSEGDDDEIEPVPVALKTLNENSTDQQRKAFEQGYILLSRLQHPNLVQMLGVSLYENVLCTVFDYKMHGNLHDFLSLRSPYSNQFDSIDNEQILLDHGDFLHIATQIAAGMQHLAANRLPHGDLAARNCAVANRLVVKIFLFGAGLDVMAIDRHAADYCALPAPSNFVASPVSNALSSNFTTSNNLSSANFTTTTSAASFSTKFLPLRWMSPESLTLTLNCGGANGKVVGSSEASDVWAFGVTLWEMYAYGARPYGQCDDSQVVDAVRQRCLLECPNSCPPRMYSLMVECWHEMPARRPAFAELLARLQTWSVVNSPAHSTVGPLVLNQSVGHLGAVGGRAGSVQSAGSSGTGGTGNGGQGYPHSAVASLGNPSQLSIGGLRSSFSRSHPQGYSMGANNATSSSMGVNSGASLLTNGSSPNLVKIRSVNGGFSIRPLANNAASQVYGFPNADLVDSSSTLS